MKIYSMNLSVHLSVNPPPEGAALRPEGPEVFMKSPRNFWWIFLYWFSIWFEKYSVTHPRKKLEDKSETKTKTIFILVFILIWKIFGDKSDTKILRVGMKLYCPIFHEFVGSFVDEFVGQPAPGGGGTPAHRAGGILENIGHFFVLGLRIFCYPFGKEKLDNK